LSSRDTNLSLPELPVIGALGNDRLGWVPKYILPVAMTATAAASQNAELVFMLRAAASLFGDGGEWPLLLRIP
jgi:hypothetical protein